MSIKETYNKIAEFWHQDHKTDDWWIAGTDKFISLLKPGSIILDAGCGGGTRTKYLLNKGFEVMGIDISENMIEIAKREAPKAIFKVLDLYNIESLKENFDGIFMQAVLLHIPKKDAPEIIKKLSKKLNPGGYLYIVVKEKSPNGPEEEIKRDNEYGFEYERFFSYFTAEELSKFLEESGLKVVSSQRNPASSGKTVWINIIGKK